MGNSHVDDEDLAVTVLCFTWVDLADGGKTSDEAASSVAGQTHLHKKVVFVVLFQTGST